MTDQVIRLSVSKTKTFIDCKKKFKFAYVLKLPKKDRDYLIFGKFCHKVLEDFHNFYVNGTDATQSENMNKAFKNAIEEFKTQMTKEMITEAWGLIHNYFTIITKDKTHNLATKVLACEKPFEVNIDNKVILNGMIDRVQIDDDGIYHVCDYKTSKSDVYLKNDFFQLLTYAYVLLDEMPELKKVRASYILMKKNFKYISKEFERDEILKVKDKFLDYYEKITKESDYKANPTPLCGYCDYLDSCDEGKAKIYKNVTFGEIEWG